jgi:hypothetical protein
MSAASDAGRATRVTLWTGHDAILKRLQTFFSEPKQLTVLKPGHITAMSCNVNEHIAPNHCAKPTYRTHIEHICQHRQKNMSFAQTSAASATPGLRISSPLTSNAWQHRKRIKTKPKNKIVLG